MDPIALVFPLYVGGIVFGNDGEPVDHSAISLRTEVGLCQAYAPPAYGGGADGTIRGDGSFQLVVRCEGDRAELLVDGRPTGVVLALPPAGGFFPTEIVRVAR